MEVNPFDDKTNHPELRKSYGSSSSRNAYFRAYKDGTFYHTPPIPAETQKARGIFFIMNKSAVVKAAFGWRVPKHILFNAGDKFDAGSFNYPVFARPCPVVPRHGFVDSTTCVDSEKLNALSQETYEEEPDAEFLVTKPVDASYGAILTDGVLTFSGGNDGATSGRNVKYFYINEDPIAPAIDLDPTVLLEGEVPFYEFVLDKQGNTNFVQVRSAPGVPKCKDFVPNPVEVKSIVKAEGDLLEWEKLMHSVDPATTVVDHTDGSLASHYAIHAIINKVPIFTTQVPNIGDTVAATVHDTNINEDDREKFFKAFCHGFSAGPHMLKKSRFFANNNARPIMNASMRLALACLHNFSSIAMAKDYEVVGITLGLFVRTCFGVSAGESRHVGSRLTNAHAADLRNWRQTIPKGRESAYNWMYKKSASKVIDEVPIIFRIFNEVSWVGGYGGAKWASCTKSSINLFNACVNRDIEKVVELFNQVLHEEHNGGKYLNKIIDVNQFDHAANNPSTYALKDMKVIIDLLSTVWDYADNAKDVPWNKFKPIDGNKKLPSEATPVGRWEITGCQVYVQSNGDITHVKAKSSKWTGWKQFTVTGLGGISGHTSWTDTASVPYYWSVGGTPVISKAALNNLIDKDMGVVKKKAKKVGGAVTSTAGFSSGISGTANYDTSPHDLIKQLKHMLEVSEKLSGASSTSSHDEAANALLTALMINDTSSSGNDF